MSPAHYPSTGELRCALASAIGLMTACLISFWVATYLLAHLLSVSTADELLGGMWTVIATIFVYRTSNKASISAALSRVAATAASFILCQLYLLVFPFSAWGMVALIGVGSVILTLIDRTDDVMRVGITTAVVMVAAGLSPEEAWLQPMQRFLDTLIGVSVGVAAVRMLSTVATMSATTTNLRHR